MKQQWSVYLLRLAFKYEVCLFRTQSRFMFSEHQILSEQSKQSRTFWYLQISGLDK